MDANMKAFIEFGKSNKISKKMAVDFFVLSLLFIGPIGFIGERKISAFIISIMLLVVSLCMLFGVWKYRDTDSFMFGYRGMQAIVMMLSLAIAGCRLLVLVFDKNVKILIFAIVILHLIVQLLYIRMIKKLISQGAYLENKKVNTVNVRFIAVNFGIFGISMARILSRGIDNDSAIMIIAMCCFMVSMLSSLGIPNLYKYVVLRKEGGWHFFN